MFEEFRKLGALHKFVVPSLYLFLIPVLSVVVFGWGQAQYDGIVRTGLERTFLENSQLDDAERQEALAFCRAMRMSKLLESKDPAHQQFVAQFPDTLKYYYLSFRWLLRIAWFCILSGIGLIALVMLSVPLAMRSQRWQYASLLAGWHSIRLFLTLQVIAQGILVVGLSFWVTALLFNSYELRLIVIALAFAGAAAFAIVRGIFKPASDACEVAGEVLDPAEAPELWRELKRVADQVGTTTPDNVVVGIDANFFVTEHPLTVAGQTLRGKTLFVSLAMLKALAGAEAAAILAHEFAHFSGNDTYYSRRIGPLLHRFNHYLQALHEAGPAARPVFSFALMLRTLYEVSVMKLSRAREFRADAIAVAAVSSQAAGDALVRSLAYSAYRRRIEQDLFDAQAAHEHVDIGHRLAAGFREFAPGFADARELREATTAHPFDSHPTLEQRLRAIGRPTDVESMRQTLATQTDSAWYGRIPDAARREAALWTAYEEGFRRAHEHSLIYRYLPSTPEEAAVVAQAFPEVALPAKKASVTVDHEKISYETWGAPVRFDAISQITTKREWGAPLLDFQLTGGRHRLLPLTSIASEQQRVIQTIQAYWHRYSVAMAYHARRKAEMEASTE